MRSRSIVWVLLVAIVMLAACSSSDESSSTPTRELEAAQLIRSSAASTVDAQSYGIELRFTVDGDAAAAATMTGAFDATGENGFLDISVDGPEGTTTFSVRVVDGAFYMNVAGLPEDEASFLPEGTEWIGFDAAALADDLGEQLEDSGELSIVDENAVTDPLAALRGVSDDVEVVGPEEVRGVPTTHYRGELSFDDAIDRAPASERDRLRRALREMGSGTVPVDVWIDDDDMVRRLEIQLDAQSLDLAAAELEGTGTLTMELYDFDAPVVVEAPPPEQTMDFLEMLADAFSQLGEVFSGGAATQ